ncbi:MAG: hypothetical protein KGS72_28185 [Cyanobacteria bacterium REEB67]|nr:hypothetical protein [Cyanobacteria bacterium REEB67]
MSISFRFPCELFNEIHPFQQDNLKRTANGSRVREVCVGLVHVVGGCDRRFCGMNGYPQITNWQAIPDSSFAAYEIVVVAVPKTPYVRFDLNDYSVPHEYVQRKLTVMADSEWVRIMDGLKEVAKHKRCFEKKRQIESTEHVANLVAEKKKAKKGSGMSLLFSTAPSAKSMFNMAAERGYPIGSLTSKLLSLLDLYGAVEIEEAIKEVVNSGACHCSDVTQVLERRRRQKGLLSPIGVQLPDDKRLRDFVVLPHSLASYDNLSGESN